MLAKLVCPALAFCMVLVGGCATTNDRPAQKAHIQYPSTARGWNGIDAVDFLQPYTLANYTSLIVEQIDTSHAVLPPKDENTYQPVATVLAKLDALTVPEYEKRLKNKIAVSTAKPDAANPSNHLVIRTTLAEFHPGSAAARFWVGFGAGSGWVMMRAELIDAKSQKVLLKIEQRRISSMRLDYAGMLASCAREVADDFAKTIALAASK